MAAELAQLPLLDLFGADLQTAVTDPGSDSWAELNTLSRAEVSQATGMLVAQLEVAPAVALVRPRAHAYATGRSATDVARDILDYAWTPTDARSSHVRHRFRCPIAGDRRRMEPIVTEIPRETRVLDAVVLLVDSLLDDFDVVDLLTELTEQCAQLLDVAAAGLLLANPLRDHLHLMAATSEKIHDLELFQLQADQGPCLDCYRTAAPISVADVQAEAARWPRFVAAATEAGFASVHAVPIRAAGTVLGALGLFGTGVGELNDADLLVAQTLAHIACVAILQVHAATPATVLPHLRTALTSRIVVDQAKGFLSQRLDVSVDDAFKLLRRYVRTHGDHLTEVSRCLITDPGGRQTILAAMRQMLAVPPS